MVETAETAETTKMAEMAETLRNKILFIINPTHKILSALPGLHWCSCTANAQNWRWQRWLAMWLSDWHCTEHG